MGIKALEGSFNVIRRLWLTSALVLGAVILAGCADRVEVERLAHVVVLGIDQEEGDFINVTFQIANPQVGSTDRGKAENEPPTDIVSIKSTDVMTARELANTIIPRRLDFSHLQTLIISEKLARSAEFHKAVSSLVRIPEIRREMHMIISRERASTFIEKNKPRMETRPHKYYEYMLDQWSKWAIVPNSTVNEYMKNLSGELYLVIYATTERTEEKTFAYEALYRAGEVPAEEADPVQMMGSAVIKEGRMIGTLNGEETRYALMLRKEDKMHSFLSSFPDPFRKDERVTVRLLKNEGTKMKIDVSGEVPKIDVKVKLYAQLWSIEGLTDYVTNLSKQELLEQAITEQLTKDTMNFIRRTQEEFRGEPFNWHKQVRKKFWSWKDYIYYDFMGKYPRAEVSVEYDLDIENFGKQFDPVKINDLHAEG
jgi:Ger(x)C family germination protein